MPVSPAEMLITNLATYLGPVAARSTVTTFCKRALGLEPDALTAAQLATVLPNFKGMLAVLLGSSKADLIVAQIGRQLR